MLPRPKAKASFATETPKFEIPRFDLPKFDVPKMEVPAAFREFAEKSVSQVKDNWEKMKAASEEASDLIEDSYATASKGAAEPISASAVVKVAAAMPMARCSRRRRSSSQARASRLAREGFGQPSCRAACS